MECILVYHPIDELWRAWMGQDSYWVEQGDTFYIDLAAGRYLKAYMEKDFDWFVTIEERVRIILHTSEVYKIRIDPHQLLQVELPF